MTALELLRSQIEDSGKQLEAALSGLTPEQADSKPVPSAMSFKEHLPHLGEAYLAVVAELSGAKHEWGSYVPAATEWEPLLEEFRGLRAKAVAAVLADDKHVQTGTAYIVAHDYYHVGQLCLNRIALDPTWDPYAIYA